MKYVRTRYCPLATGQKNERMNRKRAANELGTRGAKNGNISFAFVKMGYYYDASALRQTKIRLRRKMC